MEKEDNLPGLKEITVASSVDEFFQPMPPTMAFETTYFQAETTDDNAESASALLAIYGSTAESTTSSSDTKRPQQTEGWGSAEHIAIGDEAFNLFLTSIQSFPGGGELLKELETANLFDRKTHKLFLSEKIKLTPGEIVALFADFYADPKNPISFGKGEGGKITNFENAYQMLVEANPEEIEKLLQQIKQESETIKKAIKDGKKPNVALEARSGGDTKKYSKITRYNFFPGMSYYSRYMYLLKSNFDHFYNEAREAYRIGHKQAMAMASSQVQLNPQAKLGALVRAFVYELCACHFFTDLFAAGHTRTPRKEIFDYVRQHSKIPVNIAKDTIAGLLAHEMHDEDGRKGVIVISKKHPEPWTAYGDNCYFELEDKTNKEEMLKAMCDALKDVFYAYSNNKAAIRPDPFEYVPVAVEDQDHSPLFRVKDGKLERRRDIHNINDKNFDPDWDPLGTFIKIKSTRNVAGKEEQILKPKEQKELQDELDDLQTIQDGEISCKMM